MNNMNNMNIINNMGMNNNQLFQNNLNFMNQMNNNENLMNMQMMNMNLNKTEDITNIQEANKAIKELKKENQFLKDKLNDIEEKLKYLDYLKEYKKKMDLNYCYNQFDINAYKLDDIFNSLDSDIIKEKKDFGLINKGIRKLFNKNIKYFELLFKKVDEEFFDFSTFREILDNLDYFVIIVSTTVRNEKRKFGVFINNNLDNNNQTINQNNQMINQNRYLFNLNRNIPMPNRNNYMIIRNNSGFPGNPRTFNQNPNNQMINNYDEKTIFDSNSSSNKFFVFTFNRSEIYFKKRPNKLVPSFSIIYNKRYNRFLGKEFPIKDYPNINSINALSGENEFIIDCLELYEVKI